MALNSNADNAEFPQYLEADVQSAGAESTAMNDIVAGIYEAGAYPVLWGQVMPQLSGMVGGAGIAFGAIHLHRGLLLFPEHNFSPDCMRGVLERYHTPRNNPGVKFAASTAPLTITSLDSVVSDLELVRTDFLRPHAAAEILAWIACQRLPGS